VITVVTQGTQWGVGHGGFHTQLTQVIAPGSSVTDFRFIYDCGTKNSQGPLRDCITQYVGRLEVDRVGALDLVILSHFDYDHVSGLPWLSKMLRRHNVKVGRVFAPAITPLESLLLIAHNDPPTRWYVNLLANPYGELSSLFPGAEVALLEPATAPDFADLDERPQSQGRSPHSVSLDATDMRHVWAAIPYAHQLAISGREDFVTLVRTALEIDIERLDFDELLRTIGGDRGTLRKIKLLSADMFGHGGVNANSVCLWAGPDAMPASGRVTHDHAWGSSQLLPDHSPAAWLGTGDAVLRDAGSAGFVNYYGRPRLDSVAYVGAPHHGSEHNSDEDFWRHFRRGTRVTTHAQGLYGHPHARTLHDIEAAGLVPVPVSQLHGPMRFTSTHTFDA